MNREPPPVVNWIAFSFAAVWLLTMALFLSLVGALIYWVIIPFIAGYRV